MMMPVTNANDAMMLRMITPLFRLERNLIVVEFFRA
jgi:hypothetical protein